MFQGEDKSVKPIFSSGLITKVSHSVNANKQGDSGRDFVDKQNPHCSHSWCFSTTCH